MERTPTLEADEIRAGDDAVERVDELDDDTVEEDLLVEEVSIDGMCGVY
ncbi:MAG: mycofactocin precursor MftA [Acidimicrobiales bacterium]